MAIFRVLAIVLPIVIYALGMVMAGRMWRRRCRALSVEVQVSQQMNTALLHRLMIRNIYCEICHEKLAEPQAVILRIGPGGYDVLGHALCFAPMP